jgi:hypothetical protein
MRHHVGKLRPEAFNYLATAKAEIPTTFHIPRGAGISPSFPSSKKLSNRRYLPIQALNPGSLDAHPYGETW